MKNNCCITLSLRQYLLILLTTTLINGCQSLASQTITLNTPDYQADGIRFLPPKGSIQKDVAVVVIHGNSSQPDAPHLSALYQKLTGAGYTVLAPRMPWSSNWDGTLAQGIAVIDSAVAQAGIGHRNVVLVGHSMGGTEALYYAAGKTHSRLVAVIAIAPGHLLHQSDETLAVTQHSVIKAREMESRGQGNEREWFTEKNGDKIGDIETTPNIYLSYYDVNMYPNIDKLIDNVNYPIYWIAGHQDPLTEKYRMAFLYKRLPSYPDNKYEELEGNHLSVVSAASDHIIQWIEKLPR